MRYAVARKNGAKFPTRKIHSVVQTVLPKGAQFRLHIVDSQIGGLKVVRVVTPAWKTLSPSDRISRLLRVANIELSDTERNGILRFSVLTPDEWKFLTLKH